MPALPPSALPAQTGSGRAQGLVFVHSATRALAPHIEWAMASVLDAQVRLDWQPQPVAPAALRAELPWTGRPGLGSRLASALRTIPDLIFEVVEEPSPGREGERYASTPTLGLHRATVGVHGDIMVSEDRLRAAIAGAQSTGADLIDGIAYLLGTAWDTELEPYRVATEDTPVRVLHQVI